MATALSPDFSPATKASSPTLSSALGSGSFRNPNRVSPSILNEVSTPSELFTVIASPDRAVTSPLAITMVFTPSLVWTVTSPCSTRRPSACRHPPARPSAPARAFSLPAPTDGAWVVVVASCAASATPPADTTSTPATAHPSQPVRLPSLRIPVHLVVAPVGCRPHPVRPRLAPGACAGSSPVKVSWEPVPTKLPKHMGELTKSGPGRSLVFRVARRSRLV